MNDRPIDFSVNGQCSRCGACCSAVLPLSRPEIEQLRNAISDGNIKPHPFRKEKDPTMDMTCPFLQTGVLKASRCMVYDKRPAICRIFSCSKDFHAMTAEQFQKAYPNEHMHVALSEHYNTWNLFGQTGMSVDGEGISLGELGTATLTNEDNWKTTIQLGAVLTATTDDGEQHKFIPVKIDEDRIEGPDIMRRGYVALEWSNITEIVQKGA